MSRSALATLGAALVMMVAGCTSTDPVEPAKSSSAQFEPGSTMATIQQSGTIRIGMKTDQPGLAFRPAGTPEPSGFDVDIARLIAQGLGLSGDQIQWVTVSSFDRESKLTHGAVDIVVSSYSITPERQEIVGQAGPYFVTGQQIMVAADDSDIARPEDLEGKSVCSVTGSDSGEYVREHYGAIPSAYNSYEPCVDALLDGKIDAVTTDGAILLGFWNEHQEDLKIVGTPFTTERYGVGYRHGDVAMCEYLTETILAAYKSGAWETAFEENLGLNDIEAPTPPHPKSCTGDTSSSGTPSSGSSSSAAPSS